MKRLLQLLVFLACVFLSGTALWNVMNEDLEVEHLAQKTACAGRTNECVATKTSLERTPIAQHFEFAIAGGQRTKIKCVRRYVMVGEYACVSE